MGLLLNRQGQQTTDPRIHLGSIAGMTNSSGDAGERIDQSKHREPRTTGRDHFESADREGDSSEFHPRSTQYGHGQWFSVRCLLWSMR